MDHTEWVAYARLRVLSTQERMVQIYPLNETRAPGPHRMNCKGTMLIDSRPKCLTL